MTVKKLHSTELITALCSLAHQDSSYFEQVYYKLSESLGCSKRAPDRVSIGHRTQEAKDTSYG